MTAAANRRADRGFVLSAVVWEAASHRGHGCHALCAAPERLRADKAFALDCIGANAAAIERCSAGLRADRDVVLAAVRLEPGTLRHAAPALKADRELVRLAMRRDPCALAHASEDLRGDHSLVIDSVRRCAASARSFTMMLRHVTDELKRDRAFRRALRQAIIDTAPLVAIMSCG